MERAEQVTSPAELLAVLGRLRSLLDEAQLPPLAELRRRLEGLRFRVLVVGEPKRGKSTLINALLRRNVLPVGVVPVTAVTTTVTFGTRERVVVVYAGGVVRDEPLDALPQLVTERGNPANRRRVERVTVHVDAPLLRDGLELVDTPGAGSVYRHSAEAEEALAAMDAAVFVLTADLPLSASERDLLVKVREASVRTFLVLNKADRLDATELQEVAAFVADMTSEALGMTPEVFVCSARQSLEERLAGADDAGSGLARFEAEFDRYLRLEKVQDLQASVARRGRGLALQALDGVRIRLRLAGLDAEEATRRSDGLRRRLNRIEERAGDAADLAAAGVRHLLDELNRSAAQAEQELATAVTAETRRRLDSDVASLPVGEPQLEGRGVVVDTVRNTVETWRASQQARLEQGLRDLEERLLAGLADELAGLRMAARELLDLQLAAEADRSRLIEDTRFYYLLTEGVGWSELVTETVRRHLPLGSIRRRAAADLVAEADRLTRQQVGRVRADFQYRLQESGRALARAIEARYAASTAAVDAALADATQARGQTVRQVQELQRSLVDRAAALEDVLTIFDGLAGSVP